MLYFDYLTTFIVTFHIVQALIRRLLRNFLIVHYKKNHQFAINISKVLKRYDDVKICNGHCKQFE